MARPNESKSWFSSLSIKSKLLLMVTSSVVIALVLAFAGMAINDTAYIRSAKVEQLKSQGQMLAFNSTGVLTFQDQRAASELLRCMSMYPSVQFACIYDETDEKFAEYRADNYTQASAPSAKLVREGRQISRSAVEVYEPIFDGGDRIGAVYLTASMNDLHAQMRRYLVIGLLIMAGSLLGAALFAYFVQRSISRPVSDLAAATEAVKSQGDYSIRVAPRANDELGQLSQTFNDMLDEIQSSKSELQQAYDELEGRVEQRTAQLTGEIEQRKATQAALEHACDQAEAANRAKSEFLANMSHEIRTPLNGILGFTELLLNSHETIEPETRVEHLKTVSTSGRHLLTLINDILDLSKIEAGQMEIEVAECAPHEVINQVVSVLRARAQQKGLKLNCRWSSRVPESIQTDSGRFRQLLMNLVGNAIKFTHLGSVTLDCSLDVPSEQLQVRVIDTGIGIAAEKQQLIFRPFVQADNSVTRRYGGTGLGLAICQRLSESLGGTIQVESVEGQGSVFSVSIDTGSLKDIAFGEAPAADALDSKWQRDPIAEAELCGNGSANIENAKILLVEDGEINRKLVRLMLQDAGALVTTAENGWVGLQLAMKHTYDLILMDMQMPVMDGYTATSKIRENGLAVPIVALTAHAMKGDEEKCLSAGCNGYLTKPIQSAVLLESLGEFLGREQVSSAAPQSSAPLLASQEPAAPTDTSGEPILSTLPLDQPVYREIVIEFVGFLEQHVNEMKSAYSDEDMDALLRLAHGLKGAGGTAGFDVLTQPARSLHAYANDRDREGIEATLEELEELSQRIAATSQTTVTQS